MLYACVVLQPGSPKVPPISDATVCLFKASTAYCQVIRIKVYSPEGHFHSLFDITKAFDDMFVSQFLVGRKRT